MERTFTPGPWKIFGEANLSNHKASYIGVRSNDWVVAEVKADVEDLPVHANARLIAAAPDLLEALQALIVDRDEHGWPDFPASAMARAAIAKATK